MLCGTCSTSGVFWCESFSFLWNRQNNLPASWRNSLTMQTSQEKNKNQQKNPDCASAFSSLFFPAYKICSRHYTACKIITWCNPSFEGMCISITSCLFLVWSFWIPKPEAAPVGIVWLWLLSNASCVYAFCRNEWRKKILRTVCLLTT